MKKREKLNLEELIQEGKVNAGADGKLIDDFLEHEYERASWDAGTMGDQETLCREMYQNIMKRSRKQRLKIYRYGIAASMVLAMLTGLAIMRLKQPGQQLLYTSNLPDSLKLEDGSTVYLAAHSAIRYPAAFKGTNRMVSLLKGDAFFKVARDPGHPFIIHSANLETQVLGTSFHISLAKEASSVTVITGKVKVSSAGQVLHLLPGEQAVERSGGLEKRTLANMEKYNWYKEELSLKDVSLREVLELVKLRYGVSFKTDDEALLHTRITIYLQKKTSLGSLLNQLNYITNLKFKAYGAIVKVNP